MIRKLGAILIGFVVLAGCTTPTPSQKALPARPDQAADHAVLSDARAVELNPFHSVQLSRAADAREGARLLAGSGLMLSEAVYVAFDKYTHLAPIPPQPLDEAAAFETAHAYGAIYLVLLELLNWQDEVTPVVARQEFRRFRIQLKHVLNGETLFDEVVMVADRGEPNRFEADLARALAQIAKNLYEKP